MKINYNDQLYIINWKHGRKHFISSTGEQITETKGGITTCTIYKGKKSDPNNGIIAKAKSYCNETDVYNRSIGRKVSLTYALKACPNKVFRKTVWDIYNKECK